MSWQIAPAGLFPANAFQTPTWHAIKQDAGRYRVLAWHAGGERRALMGLREQWIPGVLRRWSLLGEPIPTAAPIDQPVALAALLSFAAQRKVDLLDCWFNMARWQPDAIPLAAERQDFGTYTVALDAPLDAIIGRMSKGHRRDYRRGLREGCAVVEGIDAPTLGSLLDETYAHGDKARPFDLPYLERVLSAEVLPKVVVSVRFEGQVVATVVAPHDPRRGYYLHGGTRRPAPIGASVIAHVEAMRRLQARGVACYDLGGVRPEGEGRLAGIGDFKRRFGGLFEPVIRWRMPLSRVGRLALAAQQRWG